MISYQIVEATRPKVMAGHARSFQEQKPLDPLRIRFIFDVDALDTCGRINNIVKIFSRAVILRQDKF